MIIDVHYHLFPKVSEKIVRDLAKSAISLAREMGQNGVNRVTERFSFEDYLDKVETHLKGDG